MTDIHHCTIFPGIGVARLGNSPDDYFVGPESPGHAADPDGAFKDASGRVKRQASRFRVYAYDDAGTVLRELTAPEATITWTVHLTNRKASWRIFKGVEAERRAAEPGGTQLPWRNPDVVDRDQLVIDPGARTIAGADQHGASYRFDGGTFLSTPVGLGELRTDAAGRLLVLGGAGRSDTVAPRNAIRNYANNDAWFDDTADGPVTATVVLADGTSVPVTGASWVIVAPPDFSPHTDNLITLYDVVRQAAVENGWLSTPASVSFTRDVYPIFVRLAGYPWVNGNAARGHDPGRVGDLLGRVDELSSDSEDAAPARRAVFARLRDPNPPDETTRIAQASMAYMPPLSGDGGDQTEGEPGTWLTLLPAQYEVLRRWADGDFEADWTDVPAAPPVLADLPVADQPAALCAAALEHCAGGAFFPGIEMTYTARDPKLYSEAFRLRDDLQPGDVTKRMAVPWQADFYQCSTHWWPAQRPDDVVSEAQYDAVLAALGSAAEGLDPLSVLPNREPWARGVDRLVPLPRPVVPARPGETDEQYRARAQAEWNLRRALAGDDGLVDRWSDLGFVVPRPMPGGAVAYVETERAPYVGLHREYFHIMLNLDEYPDFLPTARVLAEGFLAQTRDLLDDPTVPADYRPFTYTRDAFEARLEKIYQGLVDDGEQYSPSDPQRETLFTSRERVVERIRQMAPFNHLDGAWLRNATQAGPISEIHALLFAIWSDEVGNGDPLLNHANLYTDLMHSVGLHPEPVNSRAYAEDPTMLDSAFTKPLFELVISQFSQRYFPEILGMTLNLEWEVPALTRNIKLFEHFGIDASFYRMHVGIDNAASGHGAQAKRAVALYLDQERDASGEEAMQELWSRIWTGYVAFATVGGLGQEFADQFQYPETPADLVAEMIGRKRPYGHLNHGAKRLGDVPINDWFDDPSGFMEQLQKSGLIVPGDPEHSPFFALTEYTGPMYKVFTTDELRLWADWTRWLANDQQPPQPPPDPPIGALMVRLVQTMATRQHGVTGHATHELSGPDPAQPDERVTQPVSWWFDQEPTALMAALADPANGWITPGDAAHSSFITDLASGTGGMALALGGVVPGSPHLTWRSVVFDWIQQDCPIPGPATVDAIVHAAAVPSGPIPRLTLDSPVTDIVRAPVVRDLPFGTRRILGSGTLH